MSVGVCWGQRNENMCVCAGYKGMKTCEYVCVRRGQRNEYI